MATKFAEIYVLLGLKKEGFDKGVKSTKSGMKDMGKSFLTATAAIAGAGLAIYAAGKQIYAVGKRGAIVTQTAESFEYLSEKIGLAPDILEQLRKASLNTIDDMTLMSSTATLLAGTSDELGKALGANTPQLLRIAKAANKLNPSLGTTSFMYESIALGIKRASPMILDNLGITVKLGAANEAMAKSLGKSVDALSAEEKQMALLNSVLGESGERLLEQVDGLDAATDSFAQLETKVSNLSDRLKADAAPAISNFVDKINDAVYAMDRQEAALGRVIAAEKDGIITKEKMKELTNLYFEGLISEEQMLMRVEQATRNWKVEMGLADHQLVELEGHERAYIEASEDAVEVTDEMISVTNDWSGAMAGAKGALEGLTDVLQNQYKKALDASTNSVYELERAKLVLKIGTEDLSKAEIQLALDTLDSIDRIETLTQAVGDGAVSQSDFRFALMDGKITLDEFNSMMGITAETIIDATIEAYHLRDGLGEADMETQTLSDTTKTNLIPALGNLGSSLFSANAQAASLEEGLEGASGHWEAKYTLYVETVGLFKLPEMLGPPSPVPPGGTYIPPPLPPKAPEPPTGIPSQHGLGFTIPSGFPNDSFYLPLSLTSGEHVEVTPRGRSKQGGGNTYYTYYRYGDRVNIENSAQAAFLVEKQRQTDFDDISRMI